MGWKSAKPTPANIRRRVVAILDAAESLEDMATRWNPKGRYFVPRREAIRTSREIRKALTPVLSRLGG